METRSYYGADDRLRVLQKMEVRRNGDTGTENAGVWEEYRYDALGRRVMVRTRTDGGLCNHDAWACTPSTTTFVWAGDQLLWELKSASGTHASAAGGNVSYFHTGGIDRPLVITRNGESIVPHQNWRGQFARGTYADGANAGRSSDCTAYPPSGCTPIQWPGERPTAYHELEPQGEIRNWFGGLVDDMRDASGQMYRRNRYYDPQSGQFTQPDPIGLAGGLNAEGDPVTYRDAYGLCAKDENGREDSTCRAIINYLRTVGREAQPSVPRGHTNRFSQAADLYERTTRRVEMVSPNDRRLRATDGSFAAGRTTDNAFLLSKGLGAGDLAAVATHEAVVHEHERGAYTGDLFSSETDTQIWYQLPDRFKPSAPFWRNRGGKTDEPLIDW